jgi:hypothetical protein
MGSKFKSLTLTWFDATGGYATSADVESNGTIIGIPLFTDTGSGEVNEAEIILSAKNGNFINSGTIQVDTFDRIRIQMTDLDDNTYDRYFEVIERIPSQDSNGAILTLGCLGIEYHTQGINFSKREWFQNPFNVVQRIALSYESNNGTAQPLINGHLVDYSQVTKIGNGLPRFTQNHFEFGMQEDIGYNRWLDITDMMGAPVTGGGIGTFFDLGVETPAVNQIDLAVFKSGNRSRDDDDDANHITIKQTDSINVGEQEGGNLNPTATNVLAYGSPVHGSLPTGLSKYRGEELEFIYRPDWQSGIPYITGAKVLFEGKHYEATSDHTSSGTNEPTDGGAPWSQIDMSDEFGDTLSYSEWTDDKAKLWVNSGTDPDAISSIPAWATTTAYTIGDVVTESSNEYVAIENHTSGTFATDLTNEKWEQVDNASVGNGAGMPDSNLVAQDDGFFRTWVTEIAGDTDYNGSNDKGQSAVFTHSNSTHPPGYRFLNFSNTQLSGTDRFGRSFTNAVVEWRDSRGIAGFGAEWVVLYSPDSTTDRMQVVSLDDGKIYEWNNSATEWQDITDDNFGYDCLHQWKSLYNIEGFDPRPAETNSTKFPEVTKDGSTFAKNIRSAVEIVYQWNAINQIPESPGDYKKGAWLSFEFPFPVSTYNSISEGVGDLYGGGTNEANPTHPSVLDTENMSWTHDGLLGFNHGLSSEDLGPLESISFTPRIGIYSAAGTVLDGTATVRCTVYTTKDQVGVYDFEVKFTDGKTWASGVSLPLNSFTVYKARTPKSVLLRGLSITGFELPINERDIQETIEMQTIKRITFQIQNFYDKDGRYNPEQEMLGISNTGLFTSGGGTIRFAIDAFHFKKPLLVTSGQDTTRNIETFIHRPNIISYKQLQNEAKSQLEIEQFEHQEMNFQTSGKSIFDIAFGDTFFLENEDLIQETDDTTVGETAKRKIKLVNKRTEYHLTKGEVGEFGLTRSIKGVKVNTV